MKTKFQLHASRGTALVQHLRQFGDLPSNGILAGQAVDSAITDVYGKGGGVYNDLDIFRNAPGGRRLGAEHWANSLTSRSDIELHLSAPDDDYSGMSALVRFTRVYGIKSVSRHGMLNFVNCSMADGYMHRRLSAFDVIRGFDLNCTRVAIDLSTSQLVWDRHYEEFLHSRQLRIAMMYTPWHTFLRLAKKSEELPGVYADFTAAAEACVGVAQSSVIRNLERMKSVSLSFGSKHLEQAEATRSIWTPYFDLEQRELVLPVQGGWRTRDELSNADVVERTAILHALRPRGQLDSSQQERCDKLGLAVVHFASRVLDEARRTVSAGTVQKLADLRECRERAQAEDSTQPRDFVLACANTFDTSYVAGQALPAVAEKLAAWLVKHGLFKSHFFGLTLAEQHVRMQEISQLARDYGNDHYEGDTEHALGVLELTATTSDLHSRTAMLALLEADRRSSMTPFPGKPLRLPARLPALFEHFSVTELRTPYDLAREGREMHHCVGGYSQAVQRGGSRILSVKFKNHRTSPFCSTVELTARFRKDGTASGRVRISQNFTHSNKQPNEENRAFVEFLRDYLVLAGAENVPANVAEIAHDARIKQADLAAQDEAARVAVAKLEAQLKAARSTRRRLSVKLGDATRHAALYTLLTEAASSPVLVTAP